MKMLPWLLALPLPLLALSKPCLENKMDILRHPVHLNIESDSYNRGDPWFPAMFVLRLGLDLLDPVEALRQALHTHGVSTTLEESEEGSSVIILEDAVSGRGGAVFRCYLDIAALAGVGRLVVNVADADGIPYFDATGGPKEIGLSMEIILDALQGKINTMALHEFRHAIFLELKPSVFSNTFYADEHSSVDIFGEAFDAEAGDDYRTYLKMEEIYNYSLDAIFQFDRLDEINAADGRTDESEEFLYLTVYVCIDQLKRLALATKDIATDIRSHLSSNGGGLTGDFMRGYLTDSQNRLFVFRTSPGIRQLASHSFLSSLFLNKALTRQARSRLDDTTAVSSFVDETASRILDTMESRPGDKEAIRGDIEALAAFVQQKYSTTL